MKNSETFQDRNRWVTDHYYDSPDWNRGLKIDRGADGLVDVTPDADDVDVIDSIPQSSGESRYK